MITGIFGSPVTYEVDELTGNARLKLKDICSALDLAWPGQFNKVKADPHGRYQVFMGTFKAEDGKFYRSIAISHHFISNFLEDINANKLPPDKAHILDRLRVKLRDENLLTLL